MSETAQMLIGRFFLEAILDSMNNPEEWAIVEKTVAEMKGGEMK
ncbi:MAG: hypothetical protein ACI4OB_06805 [Christensenellales bacterium]